METNKPLPKIPSIKFVATRPNPNSFIHDSEEFESYRDFEAWAIDECNREFYDAYKDADIDSRRGCDGMNEWVSFTMDADEVISFVEEKGWKVSRVPE